MKHAPKLALCATKSSLSRFCHVFQRENVLCLFHAFGISPIYLGIDFKPFLDALQRGYINTDKLCTLSPMNRELTLELLAKLRAKQFVISCTEEDEQQLRAVQEKHLGHPSVAVMYLLVTDACNISCSYCFVRNNMADGYRAAMMTPELATQSVHFFARQVQLSEVKMPQVIFYGGEPLLNLTAVNAAVETIESLKETGGIPRATKMTLITNGTRVTPDIADFLKRQDITAVVSIDGPKEITTPIRIRGTKPVYEDIVRGLEILKAHGVRMGISCTLTQASLEKFDTVLAWIHAVGVQGVGFNIVRPIPPFSLSMDYAEKVASALIVGYESLTKRGITEDRMGRKVKSFVEGSVYPFDCAGCGNQIVVSPTGRVGVCAGFLGTGEYFVTDVHDKEFNHTKDPDFLAWSKRSPLATEECLACPAVGCCGGGCPYSVKIKTGNLYAVDTIFCAHAKKTLDYLIWSLSDQL